jgi:predicted transposase
MQLRLLPAPDQHHPLLATMECFNAACASLVATAQQHHCANKAELQQLAYHAVRRDFGLSAQMTIRAIGQAIDAYKRDLAVQPHDPITYDRRSLSWKGADRVSIWTLDGRALMPWLCCAYRVALSDRARGEADLSVRADMFFLEVTVDVGDAGVGRIIPIDSPVRRPPMHDAEATFDLETGAWEVRDATPVAGLRGLRREVFDLLATSRDALTPAQIAERLGAPRNAIKQMTWRMANSAPPLLRKSPAVRGGYALAVTRRRAHPN